MEQDGLFEALPVPEVQFEEMLACVDRELAMRRKVYPRWVKAGKLSQATSDLEERRLRAVRLRLLHSQAMIIAIQRAQDARLPCSASAVGLILDELVARFPEAA